jgi:hypothetical protein
MKRDSKSQLVKPLDLTKIEQPSATPASQQQ